MNLNEYQTAALMTAVYPEDKRIIYSALGMCGEAGEVDDKVKKVIRNNNQDYEKAKEKCLFKFCEEHLIDRDIDILAIDAFDYAFDHAYRLGMESGKKERQTADVESMAAKHYKHRPCENPLAEKTSCIWLCKNGCLLPSGCYYEPYTEPQEDKHFDNIVKRGFRNERRLNIAAQIMASMMQNANWGDKYSHIAQMAFAATDALIEESEKGGDK